MNKRGRLKFFLGIIFGFFVIGLVIPVAKTMACAPDGDPWYTAHLSFDKESLPAGLQTDGNYGDGYNEFAKIKNDGSIPFYLVSQKFSGKGYTNSELPEDYFPMYKMVSGKAYLYWDTGPTGIDPQGYIENLGIDLAKQWVIIRNPELNANNIYPDIRSGDNRPADFIVPSSAPFTILGFQNNHPVTLTGTINYLANQNYDPHASQPCLDHLKKTSDERQAFLKGGFYYTWWSFRTILFVILLLFLLVTTFVIIETPNITHQGRNLNRKTRVAILILAVFFISVICAYLLYEESEDAGSLQRNIQNVPSITVQP